MVDPDGPTGPAPLVPVTYQPGVDNDGPGSADPSDVFDPTVRTISNLLVDQTLGNPAAILTALQRAGIVPTTQQMAVTAEIKRAIRTADSTVQRSEQCRTRLCGNLGSCSGEIQTTRILQQRPRAPWRTLKQRRRALDGRRPTI